MDIATIIQAVFKAIEFLIWARIIVSFLPMFTRVNQYHPVIRFIYETTEPLLAPFRRIIPATGGLDFSPLLLFVVLSLVERWLLSAIR